MERKMVFEMPEVMICRNRIDC